MEIEDDHRPLFQEGDKFAQYYSKLDVLRGVKDHFYFALREHDQDYLQVTKIDLNESGSGFEITNSREPIHITDKILAFEMDP